MSEFQPRREPVETTNEEEVPQERVYTTSKDAIIVMADEARKKLGRGEEITTQESASIDYAYGGGFAQSAARDFFGV